MATLLLTLQDEAATQALAAALAARLGPGDVIALRGPLGAGKTALSRALIRALCGPETEVPSPTFTLAQTYDAPVFPLWHFDLYRIADPGELDELGWEDALAEGAALVEWPDRAGSRLPASALSVVLTPTGDDSRQAAIDGDDACWGERLAGLTLPAAHDDATDFLRAAGWGDAALRPLAGDASARRYERLSRGDGATALLVRTPAPQTDLTRFDEVGTVLRAAGLSAPRLLAVEAAAGLGLVEDFGDRSFSSLLDGGADPRPLYELAVDALIQLHKRLVGDAARPPCAEFAAFDAPRFVEQVELFCEAYLPTIINFSEIKDTATSLRRAWTAALTPVCEAGPWSLILRDYHAGNLMLLDRPGVLAAGLIDFQDAGPGPVAYDLMSLLEDARRDVADDLAAAMIERYCAAFPDLDRAAFDRGFAVLAAVRHARVLGIFVRLAAAGRDGYLVHLPRVKRLLARALKHPALAQVSSWLAEHAPRALDE